MIPWWALAVLVFGANFLVWGTVGLTRLVDQVTFSRWLARRRAVLPQNVVAHGHDPEGRRARHSNLTVADVAVLIPAHNEAAVIADSIRAITGLVPRRNVHVVSDGSTDDTFEIALRCGVKAIQTRQNVGKAGASCLLFVTLPVIVLILLVPDLASSAVTWPGYGRVYAALSAHMTLIRIFYGVVVPDLAMTCVVAVVERRPRLLLSAVFFPFLRVLDSFIGLWAIPLAWLATSNGVWKSPTRRGALGQHRQVRAGPVPVTDLPRAPGPAYAPEPVGYAEAEGHHASG